MKKLYISGKMTGLKQEEILQKFSQTEQKLKKRGHSVINPAVMWHLTSIKDFSYNDFLHIDFAMIDACDAIYVQKDWESSGGCKKEIEYAKSKRKEIIYEE